MKKLKNLIYIMTTHALEGTNVEVQNTEHGK